jgi:hypothetical protein
VVLLVCVTPTGYFGGEMTYHHAVNVNGALAPTATGTVDFVRPVLPAKPITALVGFLCIVGLGAWLTLGSRLAPAYYAEWWRAVKRDQANAGTPLWTLQRGRPSSDISASRTAKMGTPYRSAPSRRG